MFIIKTYLIYKLYVKKIKNNNNNIKNKFLLTKLFMYDRIIYSIN